MNTAELESMQAAIRTMAEAVEDLSRMCEGLPKFLETKIGEFRAEMNVVVDGMQRKLQEHGDETTTAVTRLFAQQQELDGKLQVFQDSLTVTVETTASETRQIIADNRREIEGMIEKATVDLEGKITTDRHAAKQQLSEAVATLDARVEETRQACDTTDLHHGLATVKTALETNEKLIDAVTVRMDEQSSMQGEFRSMHATLAGEVRQIGSDLSAVPEQIAAAVAPVPEQIAAAVAQTEAVRAAQHAELAGALRGEIEALAGRADELQKQIVLAESGLSKMLVSAEERGAAALQETETRLLEYVEQGESSLAELSGSIDTLRTCMVAVTAKIDDANERAVNLVRAVEDTFAGRLIASEDTLSRHTEEIARIAKDRVDIYAEIEGVGTRFAELNASVSLLEGRINEEVGLARGTAASMAEVYARVKEIDTGLNQHADELNHIAGRVDETNMDLATVREFSSATAAKVGGVLTVLPTLETEVGNLTKKVEKVSTEVGIIRTTADETDHAVETLRGLIVTVEGKVAGAVEMLETKMVQDNEAVDQRIKDFTQAAVADAVKGLLPAVESAAAEADEALTAVRQESVQQWVSMQAAVSSVREDVDTLGKTLPAAIEEVRAKVDAIKIPEPIAPVELQAIEVQPPPVEFQMAYEDGNLVVALEYKDHEEVKRVSTNIPLQIGVSYRGVYKADHQYPAGHMVSHKGSMWVSRGTATGEPGKDFTGWQLAVKRGADGKDAVPVRTYTKHESKNVYRESDFLRLNNRLWQCAVKETRSVPEPGDITSTPEWLLIGGVQ